MKELFDQLKDSSISVQRRKDLTVFLKEFLTFSASLQPNGPRGREAFYKVNCFNVLFFVHILCYHLILRFFLVIKILFCIHFFNR